MSRLAASAEANPYRPMTVQAISVLGIAFCTLFVPINLVRGVLPLAIADGVCAVVLVINLVAYRRHRNGTLATVVGAAVLNVFVVFGAHYIGSQMLAWLGPITLLCYFLLGRVGGSIYAASTLAFVGAWIAVARPEFHEGMVPVDLLLSFPLVAAVAYLYEHVRVAYANDLQRISATDPLTGAMNRRSCERKLHVEMHRAERYGRPLSVVLFDVDHFKRINDEHGHAVGDRVLCDISDVVRKTIRQNDALVRWGGEEFLILLPETGQEGAVVAAERIRRAVAAEALGGATKVPVTISAGVATMRPADDQDSLVHRADERLYRAKREGRNRVCHPAEAPAEAAVGSGGSGGAPAPAECAPA